MKSAILPLQHRYTNLLAWLGISHAKKEKRNFLLKKNKQPRTVDWTKSAAFTQDRSKMTFLTTEDIAYVLGRDKENFE